jgi:hypothetical protein
MHVSCRAIDTVEDGLAALLATRTDTPACLHLDTTELALLRQPGEAICQAAREWPDRGPAVLAAAIIASRDASFV